MRRNEATRDAVAQRIRTWTVALVFAVSIPMAHADEAAEAGAMAALDRWMTAFNSRSMPAWSETVHYPHVRFASGTVTVFDSAEQFADRRVFESLTRTGWDHSHWVGREITMSSPTKVHVETIFERFDADNVSIGRYRSLYILTREDGRWAIKARSSLAP